MPVFNDARCETAKQKCEIDVSSVWVSIAQIEHWQSGVPRSKYIQELVCAKVWKAFGCHDQNMLTVLQVPLHLHQMHEYGLFFNDKNKLYVVETIKDLVRYLCIEVE